jgi:small subunit ribosomal protein S8
MVTDTTSDLLTRIRNANLIKSQQVNVPLTKSNVEIIKILESEGYIETFTVNKNDVTIKLKYQGREQKPLITNMKRVSKPGQRIYSKSKNIPRVLGGIGILIVSTPNGLMSDRQARMKKAGGELICTVW